MDAINPDDIRRFMDWKERQKEANRRYRERHAEDIRKRRADFYEENKEIVRQKNAEYKRLQRQRDKENQRTAALNAAASKTDSFSPKKEGAAV